MKSKTKLLTFRRNSKISALFNKIEELETEQRTDKTAILERAIEYAAKNRPDYKEIASIIIDVPNVKEESTSPMKISVNESNYDIVIKDIKETFDLNRVTTPYAIKLVLINYLKKIKTNKKNINILNTVEKAIFNTIDCVSFKNAYELSHNERKEYILKLCRKYLTNYNTKLDERIREQMNETILNYSDYFNRNKYSPKPRKSFVKCNRAFTSKVLAGMMLVFIEADPNIKAEDIIEEFNSISIN